MDARAAPWVWRADVRAFRAGFALQGRGRGRARSPPGLPVLAHGGGRRRRPLGAPHHAHGRRARRLRAHRALRRRRRPPGLSRRENEERTLLSES